MTVYLFVLMHLKIQHIGKSNWVQACLLLALASVLCCSHSVHAAHCAVAESLDSSEGIELMLSETPCEHAHGPCEQDTVHSHDMEFSAAKAYRPSLQTSIVVTRSSDGASSLSWLAAVNPVSRPVVTPGALPALRTIRLLI